LEQQWANICLLAANSHPDFLAGTEENFGSAHKAVTKRSCSVMLSTMLNENKTYTLRTNIISRNVTIPEQKSIDREK
jgi:hypothetical protein